MGTYFTIKELTASTTARRLGIDNTPTIPQRHNLTQLITYILDPLRAAYGRPIRVNSGFRSAALNTAVGGAKNSEHLCRGTSAAADITAGSPAENEKLFRLAQSLRLPFRQLIDEKHYKWIHISYNPYDVRRQVLHL